MSIKNIGLAVATSLQLASGSAADFTINQAPRSPEIAQTLQQEKPTYTRADAEFYKKYKDDKNIKWKKIEFAETYISIGGIKFTRNPVQYDEVKDINGIQLDQNAYINPKDSSAHFTYEAVAKMIKAGKKVATTQEWETAVKVFDGNYGLLCQILNYPAMGMRTRDGKRTNESSCQFRLADYRENTNDAAYVSCTQKSGNWNWSLVRNARPVVFLHD